MTSHGRASANTGAISRERKPNYGYRRRSPTGPQTGTSLDVETYRLKVIKLYDSTAEDLSITTAINIHTLR